VLKRKIIIKEKWADIPNFDSYKVSNIGRVFSKKRNIILKLRTDKDGYKRVSLINNQNKRILLGVHKLVLLGFKGVDKNKPIPHHINNIKYDNRLENLMWVTISENTKHAFDIGVITAPSKTACTLYYQDNPISCYDSLSELAKALKVGRGLIENAKDKKVLDTFTVKREPIRENLPLNKEIFRYKLVKGNGRLPLRVYNSNETYYFLTLTEMAKFFNVSYKTIQLGYYKKQWKQYTITHIDFYEYYKQTH